MEARAPARSRSPDAGISLQEVSMGNEFMKGTERGVDRGTESTAGRSVAPGKVTRASRLPGHERAARRGEAGSAVQAASATPRPARDPMADVWMDAAHRGLSAFSGMEPPATSAQGHEDATASQAPVQRAAASQPAAGTQRRSAPPASGAEGGIQHNRTAFRATIRMSDAATASSAPRDSMPGQEAAGTPDFSAMAAPAAPVTQELEPGQTIRLPDIVIPSMAAVEMHDAIAGAITYNGSVAVGGAAPSGFGVTRPYTHALSGITVTAGTGTFAVAATLDNPITYQVRASTGPDGQVNIASDADPALTAANYAQVASDLTPDMGDLNGRPPRNQFWARDLTLTHERFHADEDVRYGGQGVTSAQAWLNAQTAANVGEVNTLLTRVPGRVANFVSAAMAYPGLEERAYGAGAPLYRSRATSIRTKGAAGKYP